ncbi:MAG: PCMD domain-containing protein, partial [Prevotellaceae bacterium]|nr:PCMD domain-containing protein [Prevotellaceae bacterium]
MTYIFRLPGMSGLRKIALVPVLALVFGGCTKVMDLGDETRLTGFEIKSVSPENIQLGTPLISGDTVKIPVLRGITLFPMTVAAEPQFSSETERAVTGTTFSSFDNIKFDLEDIHLNTFYLVAESGLTRPFHIKLDIREQEDRNDFRQFDVTESPQNSVLATKGYINPIKRTIILYGINVNFPLRVKASASLSGNACIMDAHNLIDEKSLELSFNSYEDSVEYNVEAENGGAREWKVFLKPAKGMAGNETQDILSAVSLNVARQSAEVKSAGYRITATGVDSEAGKFVMAVSPAVRNPGVEIVPALSVLPNSQIIGYKAGESIVFNDYNSTRDFIILDGRTGCYRNWKFALVQGDVGDIYSFPFTYSSDRSYIQMDAGATQIDNISKQIRLQLTRTASISSYWPLTVTAGSISCSEGAEPDVNPLTLTFDNISDSAGFSLVSSLGVQSSWKVSLLPPQASVQANIDSVKITGSSYPDLKDSDILVSTNTANVFIDLKDKNALPIRIQPYLHLPEGAEFQSFQNGDFMEFASFADTLSVDIVSRSGEVKRWKFCLLEKSQLHNSDFELWETSGVATIDPIPGRGRGWATANNIMVKGTAPVDNGARGRAAEMTTDIIMLPRNLITSATLFLGYFDMSTISLDKPRSMTKFGIPFEARPIAFAIDAKYAPGENYQQSVLVSGSGVMAQYKLVDLDGGDRGQIWAELIHWNGIGQLNYAGEPTPGVHVLARGEYVASGRTEWTRLRIPLERGPEYEQYQ